MTFQHAHTFSICAVDPDTGEAGVAVASCCLCVGALVPYAEPELGAIATQALVRAAYGVKGLALLRAGMQPEEVLRLLVAEDITETADDPKTRQQYGGEHLIREGEDFVTDPAAGRITWLTSRLRQVGMVDRNGRAAAFTGARTQPWAGHHIGMGYCCQGNLLAGGQVLAEMALAFEQRRRDGTGLVASLWAALAAGEAAGGDRRGKLAAAILVTRKQAHWTGGDRFCDIRVDAHQEAVGELGHILARHAFI